MGTKASQAQAPTTWLDQLEQQVKVESLVPEG